MKITPILALLSLLLTSCAVAHAEQPIVPTQTAVLSGSATPIPTQILTSASTSTPTLVLVDRTIPGTAEEFANPSPETWVDVRPAVREYFYYRKQAIISSEVSMLWERYPDLEQGMDDRAGINVEKKAVNNYSVLKAFDGNIFPEYYEPIHVKMSGDTVEVLAHGMELYLFTDDSGKFEESGGEFLIILSLRKQDGLWTVFQTTDISGP